ncbi:hypothetical protein LY76DRAFT_680567 [Colletotrichum caudatum]|nr:hypothetical protein LY76DRAFT_680567 [Colletotrichum caudatum]
MPPPVANFGDPHAFPGAEELSSAKWETEGLRRTHWVLLAQIEHINVDAKSLALRFRDAFRTLINGRTVAVLYPKHQHVVHVANDRTTIRLEDLVRMNRKLRDYLGTSFIPQTCHGCGNTVVEDDALFNCGKCGYYPYCNVGCQKIGWDEKGHKEACRILKDTNIQSLLHLNYQSSEGEVKFPV